MSYLNIPQGDICRDCMWVVLDPNRTCWEYCEGRHRPGAKIKRKPTIYRTNSIEKALKLMRLCQIDDVIIVDENGLLFLHKTIP